MEGREKVGSEVKKKPTSEPLQLPSQAKSVCGKGYDASRTSSKSALSDECRSSDVGLTLIQNAVPPTLSWKPEAGCSYCALGRSYKVSRSAKSKIGLCSADIRREELKITAHMKDRVQLLHALTRLS